MGGKTMRYADLVGAPAVDEVEGGRPLAARSITRLSNPHGLASMELCRLVYDPAVGRYLAPALAETVAAPGRASGPAVS